MDLLFSLFSLSLCLLVPPPPLTLYTHVHVNYMYMYTYQHGHTCTCTLCICISHRYGGLYAADVQCRLQGINYSSLPRDITIHVHVYFSIIWQVHKSIQYYTGNRNKYLCIAWAGHRLHMIRVLCLTRSSVSVADWFIKWGPPQIVFLLDNGAVP